MGDIAMLHREVYHTSEAAKLLGVASSTLASWLDGRTRNNRPHPPVLRDHPRRHDQRTVTWGEFIEAGHLAAYRRGERIASRRLRVHVDDCRCRHNGPYPLACRPRNIQTLTPAQQQSVDVFFDRVDFEDSIAVRYWPDDRCTHVVLDPVCQFGRPTICGTRITTSTLHGMNIGGDPTDWLADAYNLETVQVEDAIDFERRLADRPLVTYTST